MTADRPPEVKPTPIDQLVECLQSWMTWAHNSPSTIYGNLQSRHRQIRLLQLLPDHYSAPLRARFCIISLNNKRVAPYETISYAWGSPIRTAIIKIAGTGLPIPESTAAVLRRVRLRDRKRLLWSDAVCINQDDVDERSEQVGLMRFIYSGSCGNLIHLTDDDDMAERVIRFAHSLDDEIREETNECRLYRRMVQTTLGAASSMIREYRADLDRDALRFMILLPCFRYVHLTLHE
ncbi:hypothetical protein LTR95_017484 [Oleoguttula sp. CCFEE 5521]